MIVPRQSDPHLRARSCIRSLSSSGGGRGLAPWYISLIIIPRSCPITLAGAAIRANGSRSTARRGEPRGKSPRLRHTAFLDFFGGFPNAPNGLNSPRRKSYVYLRFRSYFRTGRWPDHSVPLSPFLCVSSLSFLRLRLIALLYDFCPARSLVSSFITPCLLLCLSLLPRLALAPFPLAPPPPRFQVIPCFSPFVLSSSFSSFSGDFIPPSSSSYLRARLFALARSLRTRRLPFIHSISLSFFGCTIVHLFRRSSLSFSPFLASRNRQTFQRFALHCTLVRYPVIVKRLYSLDWYQQRHTAFPSFL